MTSNVEIRVYVNCVVRLPQEFLMQNADADEFELSDVFIRTLFPEWFNVSNNDDVDVVVSDGIADISFTFDTYTTEHYRRGDWYTPDEYSYDWEWQDFAMPKELCIKMNQEFETTD